MPVRKKPGERKNDYINRCIGIEINSGMKANQAVAVCNSMWQELSLNEIKKKRKFQKLEEAKMIDAFERVGGEDFTQYGLTINDLLNPKNQNSQVDSDELNYKFEDIPEGYVVRYKYVSFIEGHQAERPFCKWMTSPKMEKYWWSRKEIETLNNEPGKANRAGNKPYSVFNWRGGNYCKHIWVRYLYNPDTNDFYSTPVQPLQKSTQPND